MIINNTNSITNAHPNFNTNSSTNPSQIQALKREQIAGLTIEQKSGFTTEQIASLNESQMHALIKRKIKERSVSLLAKTNYDDFNVAIFNSYELTNQTLNKDSSTQTAATKILTKDTTNNNKFLTSLTAKSPLPITTVKTTIPNYQLDWKEITQLNKPLPNSTIKIKNKHNLKSALLL